MVDSMVMSEKFYGQIFSMAKIKNIEDVPLYVQNKVSRMPYGDLEGWWGDHKDASKCTKFAFSFCNGYHSFYFYFDQDSTPSRGSPVAEAFQFRMLKARTDDNKWFYKLFNPSDLDGVIRVVISRGDDAISELGMTTSKVQSPLVKSAYQVPNVHGVDLSDLRELAYFQGLLNSFR